MNVSNLVLAAAFAAANANAADPRADAALDSIAVHGARIVVDCVDVRVPTFRAVADLINSNNITLIHAQRERLLHTAQRICLRGAAARVAFVRDEDAVPPALVLATP